LIKVLDELLYPNVVYMLHLSLISFSIYFTCI